MGKGIIKSGGADGFYNVELTLERERVVKTITNIDSQIDSLTEIIDATEDGNVKELIKLERNSYIKRKEYLQNNMPEDPTVSAWCADLTEDITGNVGTIEVPGERGIIQIQPGHEGNSIYDATRDGQLQPSIAGTPAATFYNLAMLPGWQKWKPTYRYGVISNIDTEANTCNVQLDIVESSQQNLDINQEIDLTGISVSYMDCNSVAFEYGDNVLVKFDGQDWSGAKVVGFKENPKACAVECVYVKMEVAAGYKCFVWDVIANQYASVLKNDGNPASFPCDIGDISNWHADQSDIGSQLFTAVACGRSSSYLSELSCHSGDWGTTGSTSDSKQDASDCGCGFVDEGSCSNTWDLTTKCYWWPGHPNWIWSGVNEEIRLAHVLWEGLSGIAREPKKNIFLNGSDVQSAFRIELKDSFEETSWSASGASCGGETCDNIRLDSGVYSKIYKYHTPIETDILKIDSSGTESWDMCNDIGARSQSDYLDNHRLNNRGVYSDTIIAQIYTVEARTISREADCAVDDNNFCLGSDCTIQDKCPWKNVEYASTGLKIAAQVGNFEDTDGIDPTGLSRNSSFESAITGMYNVLCTEESIPEDDIADAFIAMCILKG